MRREGSKGENQRERGMDGEKGEEKEEAEEYYMLEERRRKDCHVELMINDT